MTEWNILTGDTIEMMRTMPDESVHCVVTSPPYWGLRDYGAEGMIGLEPTLAEHMQTMVSVFREVRRVLRSDGTLWLNYGDAYSNGGKPQTGDTKTGFNERYFGTESKPGLKQAGHGKARKTPGLDCGLAAKQRMMLPARVALALQDDGWWLRSEIVWAKGVSFCPTYAGSCMPSSVSDRPTDSHEMLYLMSKSPRYFYDAHAVREKAKYGRGTDPTGRMFGRVGIEANHSPGAKGHTGEGGRNIRTVWCINPQKFSEAHFATFPERLVEPCIKAGCPVGGTVMDPFSGSGTTGAVAVRLGRNYIGVELNPDYVELSRKRIGQAAAGAGAGGTLTIDEDAKASQMGLF